MDIAEFYSKRNDLLDRKREFLNEINLEYTDIVKSFVKSNSPVEKGKVYELVDGGHKRRGLNRFVVYDLTARTIIDGKYAHILASGWWMDKDSIPKKWDTYQVYGDISPIAVFKLSENQENKEVTNEVLDSQ